MYVVAEAVEDGVTDGGVSYDIAPVLDQKQVPEEGAPPGRAGVAEFKRVVARRISTVTRSVTPTVGPG